MGTSATYRAAEQPCKGERLQPGTCIFLWPDEKTVVLSRERFAADNGRPRTYIGDSAQNPSTTWCYQAPRPWRFADERVLREKGAEEGNCPASLREGRTIFEFRFSAGFRIREIRAPPLSRPVAEYRLRRLQCSV